MYLGYQHSATTNSGFFLGLCLKPQLLFVLGTWEVLDGDSEEGQPFALGFCWKQKLVCTVTSSESNGAFSIDTFCAYSWESTWNWVACCQPNESRRSCPPMFDCFLQGCWDLLNHDDKKEWLPQEWLWNLSFPIEKDRDRFPLLNRWWFHNSASLPSAEPRIPKHFLLLIFNGPWRSDGHCLAMTGGVVSAEKPAATFSQKLLWRVIS